jgi:lipopolysaccharide transport system ATP-binding protein
MSSDSIAIRVDRVTKAYTIYDRPQHRLWHAVMRRFESVAPSAGRGLARQFLALDDVSLRVMKGQTVGILGRNGAGKSTLLQVIAGTLQPTSGSIDVDGKVAALLELGSGFNHEFTGIENVYLNAAVLGLSRAETESRLDAILAFAEIGDYVHQPVKTYSSGMTMRLAFAVAVHLDPAVMIIDEALSVGDLRFQNKCLRRLDEFRHDGRSILLVSHNPSLMEAFCDHVVWLDAGRIRAEGPPAVVVRDYVNFMMHGIDAPAAHGVSVDPAAVMAGESALVDAWNWVVVGPRRNLRETGAAHFERLRLACDGVCNPAQIASAPTRFELEVEVSVSRDVERPLFGVGVFNELNEPVVHFNTYNLGCPPRSIRAGTRVTLHAAATLPVLRPGQYLVAVGVDDGVPGASELLCHLYDAWQLRVASAGTGRIQGGQVQVPDARLELAVAPS